jgi:hypothetical protein
MAEKIVNAKDLLRDICQAEAALRWFEQKYGLLSETFYRLYQQGKIRDEDPAEIQEYLEWAGWCEICQDRRRSLIARVNAENEDPAPASGATPAPGPRAAHS